MTFTSEAPRARALPPSDRRPAPVPAACDGSLTLTLRHAGSTTVLALAGRFDATGLRAVEGLIDHIGCSAVDHLLVEASALDHVDEPGVRMLVALDCYMRARGGHLTVVDAGEQVQAALGDAGLALGDSGPALGDSGPAMDGAGPAARAARPGAGPARPEPAPSFN